MSSFLRKTAIALLIAALFHVAAGFLADGTTDEYYLRFTTARQRSMILGGSRAAQGLHPSVFNGTADGTDFEGPLYCFAFTMAHSPYGRTYLDAIKEKLDTSTRNGLFILQVDPWLLSTAGDGAVEPERERALGEQFTWSYRPNYEYLTRYWNRGWGALSHWPMGDPDTTSVLMSDGRLAVNVALDSASVRHRTVNKTRTYREEYLPGRTLAPERLEQLRATVELLGDHGTVVLTRLPVGEDIANMEHTLAPDFNVWMDAIAFGNDALYINLDTVAATFTDGNHLDETSGLRVTGALREAIHERLR